MRGYRAGSLVLAIALAMAPLHAQRPDSAMVGAWLGTAHITVDWTVQKELDVRIALYADGTIAGSVGDAALVNARMHPNRTFLQKALGLGTDYLIEGSLTGPILRAENVQRESVRIPLSWNGTAFTGSLATNGPADGDRYTMRLTASDLVLRRAPTIISTIK